MTALLALGSVISLLWYKSKLNQSNALALIYFLKPHECWNRDLLHIRRLDSISPSLCCFLFKDNIRIKGHFQFSSSDLNLFHQPGWSRRSDRCHGFLERARREDLLHISWFPGCLPAAGCDVRVFHAEQVNSPVFEFTTFWLRNSTNSLTGKCCCWTSR